MSKGGDNWHPGNPLGKGFPLGHTLREDGQSHRAAWCGVLRPDTCSYCTAAGPAGTVDHVTPRFKQGKTHPENLTGACQPCNESKGADRLLHWMLRRSRQPVYGR